MVLGMEDYDESASNHYLLFSCRRYTKFAPDRCFGLLKKAYKISCVSLLYEFARLVETSSSTRVNKAQLVGTHNGSVIVPVYDWISFLGQYFKKLPNITKFHHFRFSWENPEMVFYKEFVSTRNNHSCC